MTEIKVDFKYNKLDKTVTLKLSDYEIQFENQNECTDFICGLWDIWIKLLTHNKYVQEHKN